MPVPAFYEFMKPALVLHEDGKPHPFAEVKAFVANSCHLSADDLAEIKTTGRNTTVFTDRLHWALTYLRQAELIKSVGRAVNQITPDGLAYLPKSPDVITVKDLKAIPAYMANQKPPMSKQDAQSVTKDVSALPSLPESATPEETIADTHAALRESLAQDVLERVKAMPPAFFERLIVQLMLRLGYGGGAEEAGQALGKSGDGGVDGVISEDKLGLDKIYLQAKRYTNGTVGRPEVQAFVGALSGQGASKGVFITTSAFAAPAKEYARQNHSFKVSLIEGVELARLMIDYDLGVSLVQRYDVKRIDSDFFAEQ